MAAFFGAILILWTALLLLITSFQILRRFNAWWYEPKGKSLIDAPLPPGDLGWPIFGHMFSFFREFISSDPNTFTESYTKKHGKSGVYRTHLVGAPTILVTKGDVARSVYFHDEVFHSGWPDYFKHVLGETSIALVSGDNHRRLKKLTGKFLQGAEMLSRFAVQMQEDVKELENWAHEKVINTYDAVHKVVFDRMVKTLISCGERSELDEYAKLMSQLSLALRAMPFGNFELPGTPFHQGIQARLLLEKKIRPIIFRRRAGERKEDVLQMWMDQVDDDGQALTDGELLDMLVGYMLAGHKSSALSLIWFMVLMNAHPEVLEKVRAEAQGVRNQKPPGELLTFEDTRKLKYFRHVHDEILRYVNPNPFTFRKAAETSTLHGFTVPKGWRVQTVLQSIHYDPDVYADPHVFNPDRWIGRTVKPGQLVAFGDGQRLCPGQQFARMNVATIAYYLALDYKWEPINASYKTQVLPTPRPECGYPVRFSRVRS